MSITLVAVIDVRQSTAVATCRSRILITQPAASDTWLCRHVLTNPAAYVRALSVVYGERDETQALAVLPVD